MNRLKNLTLAATEWLNRNPSPAIIDDPENEPTEQAARLFLKFREELEFL